MSERCEYMRTSGTTHWCALAAAPRQWVGLTEEEIFAAENSVPDEAITDRNWCVYFARAIEAKLKEKNRE